MSIKESSEEQGMHCAKENLVATDKLSKLLKIMAMLRDKEHGCPWDIEQDFHSVAPHTLEEAYEVVDAIENNDHKQLKNELGDLLFQVVFYAQMAQEQSLFNFSDVVSEISHKLLTRHPHVFPEASIENFGKNSELSPQQVEANWEKIKEQERREKRSGIRGDKEASSLNSVSILDDVPLALPGLMRAVKLQKRAATKGFDWNQVSEVMLKVKEELAELEEAMVEESAEHINEELGDLLFSVVNLSRHLKKNPETSLRDANKKFENRFRALEIMLDAEKLIMETLSLEELEHYWQKIKQLEA